MSLAKREIMCYLIVAYRVREVLLVPACGLKR
nr:MAG TPA: hypothetical protein [Caudoviricetes sp.]